MAPEDHRSTHVLAKGEVAVGALEIPLAQRLMDGLHLPARVHRVTADVERVVVDIRRIDLHAPLEVLFAHRLGQHHRQAVRLLAARATGRPDADPLLLACLQQPRHDLLAEEVPGDLVAEERGDVDEDGVEEIDELRGCPLEVRLVVREPFDSRRLHPLPDASREAGSLVPGEVETAVGPDELEQCLEVWVRLFLLAHWLCAAPSGVSSASEVNSGTNSSSARRIATPCSTAPFA